MKTIYQIRKTIYRNNPGFLVMSIGTGMFGERIFVKTRACAEHIKAKLIAGIELTLVDYEEVA